VRVGGAGDLRSTERAIASKPGGCKRVGGEILGEVEGGGHGNLSLIHFR
jgi:hypothetical protein